MILNTWPPSNLDSSWCRGSNASGCLESLRHDHLLHDFSLLLDDKMRVALHHRGTRDRGLYGVAAAITRRPLAQFSLRRVPHGGGQASRRDSRQLPAIHIFDDAVPPRVVEVSGLFQRIGGLLGFLPAVEDAKDDADFAVDFVVDGVGEAFREQPVEVKHLQVDANVQLEGIDVGKQGVEKVVADAFALPSIEPSPAPDPGAPTAGS